MAERHQAAGGEQVEAQRQDGEDSSLGDQLLCEESHGGMGDQRGGRERDADRPRAIVRVITVSALHREAPRRHEAARAEDQTSAMTR
jgi:hypothetical protein